MLCLRLPMLFACCALGASPGFAQQTQTAAASVSAQQTPSPPSLGPSLTGPLQLDSIPLHFDGGPLGLVYVSGMLSGVGLAQDHPSAGDRHSIADLSNGMLIVQTVEGPVQFYAQIGGYSVPSLGTPYVHARDLVGMTYGNVPVAYVKIAPSSALNLEAGKLLTLQGAENLFTFQNFNVERGLLWNQTASINRGIQANYAKGPISVSVSLNDGFYSNKLNWLSATMGYSRSTRDSFTIGAAANLGHTSRSTFATPVILNNGQLYFLSWTHTDGPWTIQPYVQWEHAPANMIHGIAHGASTYGGAILGKYSFDKHWALAARAEIIKSTGSIARGTPNLLFGPGSGALSLTLTPTWQRGIFFARAEGSYVRAWSLVPGFGLGTQSNDSIQFRGLIEAGIII